MKLETVPVPILCAQSAGLPELWYVWDILQCSVTSTHLPALSSHKGKKI